MHCCFIHWASLNVLSVLVLFFDCSYLINAAVYTAVACSSNRLSEFDSITTTTCTLGCERCQNTSKPATVLQLKALQREGRPASASSTSATNALCETFVITFGSATIKKKLGKIWLTCVTQYYFPVTWYHFYLSWCWWYRYKYEGYFTILSYMHVMLLQVYR